MTLAVKVVLNTHTTHLLTTLWKKTFENICEKEKMLVASIFSYSTMFSDRL